MTRETLSAETVRHAESAHDHRRTACDEVLLNKDAAGRVVILAAPGSVVTCELCKGCIAFFQDRYTGNYRRRRGK